MRVAEYVQTILRSPLFEPRITDHRVLPERAANFADCRIPWSKPIQNLLASRNIRLYTHQALACDHIRAGHAVVVSTPTASGKSLIYTLPVFETCLQDPDAHALYLFPLKALAQDQRKSLTEFAQAWPKDARPTAALYDGDTPESLRKEIRAHPPRVLITNPEMLHLAILPWHAQWTSFLAGLRYLIVDEAHMYRGVFGSNMAHVFRRLNRIVARYGCEPVPILCTATVGNPLELATNLINPGPAHPFVQIDKSGAPQGARHFLFIKPEEQSPSTLAIDLIQTALQQKLRTIVYCRSRRMTELISLWASNAAPKAYKDKISAYRAGFLPEERREIEAKMASGELCCVVSTSALELGIDIGDLDVCILVGYPGTIMATMQRGGRVGRASQESVVILLAGEDALDQYFITHPDDFFARPPEKAIVNPDNEIIAARHLECAAVELPLRVDEPWLAAEGIQRAISRLRAHGDLLPSADGNFLLSNKKAPQRTLALRSAGQSATIEDSFGQCIGMLDTYRLWREAHPGAVYLHRGRSYVIERIDTAAARVIAREDRVNWYTRIRAQKSTEILEELERMAIGRALVCRGRLRITDHVTGYEKRANYGNTLLSVQPLDAPPQIFETEGFWYVIPDNIRCAMEDAFVHFMGSIHAMEHAIIGLLPLRVMADRNDFGGISIPLHPQLGLAAVFIYDGIPGGAGLTRAAFPAAKEILTTTQNLLTTCPCPDGCPSCVHSPKCGSGNRPISKSGAMTLLAALLEDGQEGEDLARTLTIAYKTSQDPTPTSAQPKVAVHEDVKVDVKASVPNQAPHIPLTLISHAHTPKAPPAHYVVFDVETRRSAKEVGGWDNTDKMGVSIAIAYDSNTDRYLRFEEAHIPDLIALMQSADQVVGFNSLAFDYRVLQPFTTFALSHLPSFDLFAKVKERTHTRISLNNIAQATLGISKSADGLRALTWWKEGNLDAIATYCTQDVRVTKELYVFALANGYILYTAKSGHSVRVNLDLA